jgi:hypothetical protein
MAHPFSGYEPESVVTDTSLPRAGPEAWSYPTERDPTRTYALLGIAANRATTENNVTGRSNSQELLIDI